MNIFGVIPARGGSKGIPRKNLLLLGGKPLIAYTIEAAKTSRRLTSWVVSTDDEEIAAVARQWGAPVPFLRPPELARDDSPMVLVLQHAVRLEEQRTGQKPDLIVLLQPVTPFLSSRRIDEAIDKLLATGADSVLTLRETDYSPYFMIRLEEGDRVVHLFPNEIKKFARRQEVPPTYRPSGGVYISRYKTVMAENRLLGEGIRSIVTPFEESINIDSVWDYKMAELILQEKREVVAR